MSTVDLRQIGVCQCMPNEIIVGPCREPPTRETPLEVFVVREGVVGLWCVLVGDGVVGRG